MQQSPGIITIPSSSSVDQTVEILKQRMLEVGVTLFCVIDHSGEAQRVGMQMPPTKLLIFGNPKAGTPVMLHAPSIALDLPLKLLVWQGNDGNTWISYNDVDYLRQRHNVSEEFMKNLGAAAALADKASA